MNLARAALQGAWLMGVVYATIPAFWLVIHPFAHYWRSRRGMIFPLLGLLWIAMWLLAGWLTAPYRYTRLWPEWSWLGAIALIGLALPIYRSVFRSFSGAKITGQAELRPQEHEQKLVTTGMHARMRHPIYLGHWLTLTAWTIGAGSVALVALWVVAVVTGVLMVRFEDRELEQRFGEEYREYKRRVPAVIPRL